MSLTSLAYQDVHGDQQPERSDIEAKIFSDVARVASAVAGACLYPV